MKSRNEPNIHAKEINLGGGSIHDYVYFRFIFDIKYCEQPKCQIVGYIVFKNVIY